MSLSPWDDALFTPVSMIRSLIEIQSKITIFDGPPGKLALLPNKLGGDPAEWPTLAAAAAKGRAAFFALLAAKAHYLMLPKSIIAALDVPMVFLSEAPVTIPSTGGETINHNGTLVEIRIPQQSNLLAQAGYRFGRSTGGAQDPQFQAPGAYYDILGLIYHEMTHAWLDLPETTYSVLGQAIGAYMSAVDTNNTPLGPQNGVRAMSEAAAYYVSDRITRWGRALDALDILARTTLFSSSSLLTQLQSIEDAYNTPQSVYGTVYIQSAPGLYYRAQIASPALPDAFRDFINGTILDGLPLTKPFNDTPLTQVRDALLNP